MEVDISWRSQAGMRTDDNRDHGGIGIRGGETLCVIADGSSTAPDSGTLAKALIYALVDWYVACDLAMKPEVILSELRRLHGSLSKKYPRASASYMIVHIGTDGTGIVLHAGDCLMGRRNDEGVAEWLTRPHTLANAVSDIPIEAIINLPERHRLTRSFRSREFIAPDIGEVEIGKELLLATDGFWADLQPEDQLRFIDDDISMPENGDDRSVLRIKRSDAFEARCVHTRDGTADNFYVGERA